MTAISGNHFNMMKIFTKIKIEDFSEVTLSNLHIWHRVRFYLLLLLLSYLFGSYGD